MSAKRKGARRTRAKLRWRAGTRVVAVRDISVQDPGVLEKIRGAYRSGDPTPITAPVRRTYPVGTLGTVLVNCYGLNVQVRWDIDKRKATVARDNLARIRFT